MTHEHLKNLKRRSKSISAGDYNTIDLDDIYLLATGDYQVEEMEAPLNSLRPPLWDWLTIYNKKNKKIWYMDFSCPYTHENFINFTREEKINLAVIDLFYKHAYDLKKHIPISSLSSVRSLKENDYYEMTKDYYRKYNNWELTFDSYQKRVEGNKQWNEDIVVLYKEKQDFCVIMPHSYLKKDDITIKEVFQEVLMTIKSGKVKPKHENKKYFKLIEEINFDLNLFDKEKNVERFI
jgi:hypothetical protein